jgi:hypothetical protein
MIVRWEDLCSSMVHSFIMIVDIHSISCLGRIVQKLLSCEKGDGKKDTVPVPVRRRRQTSTGRVKACGKATGLKYIQSQKYCRTHFTEKPSHAGCFRPIDCNRLQKDNTNSWFIKLRNVMLTLMQTITENC